jgi:hypothetical protein
MAMGKVKTRSLEAIERRMENVDKGSLRYQILQSAKNFKASWIELGRALYSVWRDKLYKEWGYLTFEAYTSKEIGIRKETALKLLRSYYFLEKEEPGYLARAHAESREAASVPSYESVNVLRLAKNKKVLDEKDYASLKEAVFEKGKDAREVKRDLTTLIRERAPLPPEEARNKRKVASVRRLLSIMKSLKKDLELSKLVNADIIKDIANLISRVEAEL